MLNINREKYFSIFRLALTAFFLILLLINNVLCQEETVENEVINNTEDEDLVYETPMAPENSYFFEPFDDDGLYEKKWVRSSAKKEEVDVNVAKYDGVFSLEPLEQNFLPGDKGLILKSKAKHAAISAKLQRPFYFNTKPFIVQYEVNHQNGQECGGAYIKLLSESKSAGDLKKFNDKTPYTIMFGPDKCGNDHKLHFIFRHVNPITKSVEEKHCKRPTEKIEAPFKDKKTHLYTLVLQPDSSFQVLLDQQLVNSGNLLEDFTPPVNPPKEINDPNDRKPSDWDDREKIEDPSVTKPEDWDENAPRQIVDLFAEKPEGWLEDEEDLIPDPEAVKPDDWDNEMDGEWEAPLVPNEKCTGAPGCGKWKPPMIDNPNFKGKWKATLIDNPNYKGKWGPRRIHNPDYFEDLEPFKMTPIGGVGIEIWSMSDGIYFDNILITESMDEANLLASQTFERKREKLENYQKGMFTRLIEYSNANPWMYGVYVLVLAIPVVLIFVCCCAEDTKTDKDALRKKTDQPDVDDAIENEEGRLITEGENEIEGEQNEAPDEDQEEDQNEAPDGDQEEDSKADDVPESKSGSEVEKSDDEERRSTRQRKIRKE